MAEISGVTGGASTRRTSVSQSWLPYVRRTATSSPRCSRRTLGPNLGNGEDVHLDRHGCFIDVGSQAVLGTYDESQLPLQHLRRSEPA